MPSPLGFDVETSGVLFRDPGPALRRGGDALEDESGRLAVAAIQRRLDSVLVNPTGHYRSSIVADRRRDIVLVSDDRVVYGPWLEGVTGRNQASRFKGYSTFRKSVDEVDRQIPLATQQQQMTLARSLEAP